MEAKVVYRCVQNSYIYFNIRIKIHDVTTSTTKGASLRRFRWYTSRAMHAPIVICIIMQR